MQVNMFDAKSQLSKLVKAALGGEEVIIANKGVPAVRLVPVAASLPSRKPGAWAHLKMTEAQIADAFSPATAAMVAGLFDGDISKSPTARIRSSAKEKMVRQPKPKPGHKASIKRNEKK